MKYNSLNIALVLFVLSTTIILSSTINAYAADADGRGDSGVGSIEACLNAGQPPNFWPCDTADEWSGGNITNEAGYREGSSIPVRVDITSLENSTEAKFQELVVSWDITKTQGNIVKHTFDYITSFDRNDSPHPCLDALPLDVCENWVKDTIAIPAPGNLTTSASTMDGVNGTNTNATLGQPLSSFNSLPSNERLFTMFAPIGQNITINEIRYNSEGDPSNTGSNTESTELWINYTSSSSHVIAAFGAHVASPDDWTQSAVSVNGKSFQIECDEVHAKGGCAGGQINLDAFDVIFPLSAPELTLKKSVINDNGGTAKTGDWLLTAEHPTNNGRDIIVYGNNTRGSLVDIDTIYTLSENVGPVGYTAQDNGLFNCTINTRDGNLLRYQNSTSTISLSTNEFATCTITNDDNGSNLTLIKQVINDNGGNAAPDDFMLTVNGTLVQSGNTITYDSNKPLIINETQLAGYTFTSITGDAKCPTVLGGNVTLDEGENITCTITNDDIAPQLTIVKEITNDNGGALQVSDVALFINGSEVTNGTANTLSAGDYVVTESF
jgi:hypothetical protein